LAGLWALGFGGHINPEDLCGNDRYSRTLYHSRVREIQEELGLSEDEYKVTETGKRLIYRQFEAPVSRVHVAVFCSLSVSLEVAERIVSEKNADPEVAKKVWLPISDLLKRGPLVEFEDWSKIVIKNLIIA